LSTDSLVDVEYMWDRDDSLTQSDDDEEHEYEQHDNGDNGCSDMGESKIPDALKWAPW
jgi:hypothetical protein